MEVDGIGVAEVPGERVDNPMFCLKDLGFGVGGIRAGEEVVGRTEDSRCYLSSNERMGGPNKLHDEGDDTGGEGTIHRCRPRRLVSQKLPMLRVPCYAKTDRCPLTWMTHRRSPHQASSHTVTSSALLSRRCPSCPPLSQRRLHAHRVGRTRGNHLMDKLISESPAPLVRSSIRSPPPMPRARRKAGVSRQVSVSQPGPQGEIKTTILNQAAIARRREAATKARSDILQGNYSCIV